MYILDTELLKWTFEVSQGCPGNAASITIEKKKTIIKEIHRVSDATFSQVQNSQFWDHVTQSFIPTFCPKIPGADLREKFQSFLHIQFSFLFLFSVPKPSLVRVASVERHITQKDVSISVSDIWGQIGRGYAAPS